MLLRLSLGEDEAARAIEAAVDAAIADGLRTPDLMPSAAAGTDSGLTRVAGRTITERVIEALGAGRQTSVAEAVPAGGTS
jgi:3-isopropylmalate dehydrogenase